MLLKTHSFEFGEFCFRTDEKVLLRGGKPLPVTPKTLQLLSVLIENHGRIVEKEKLMKTVWADSFVEDGNLTFTIRLLRKALGDDSHNPHYIETVPRRGYRFIADVREIAAESKIPLLPEQNIQRTSKGFYIPIFSITLLLVGAIAFSAWYVRNGSKTNAPVLSAPFASEKLSNNGKVIIAVITPDGKNVIYRNSGGDGKQSIWLRQIDSSSNIEIIPPSDDAYFSLTTSPDGNHLYFTRRPRSEDRQPDLYKISMFGGVPVKIVNETQGWISFSPDGAKISFVRCPYREDENCSLFIADADGANEQKLVSRPRPFRISDNKISPDGKSIAFAAGQSENGANEFSLSEINLENGTERSITAQKFFNIKSLAWLPDQDGLLLTASQKNDRTFRIWQISADGEAQALTQDSETYASLSLDRAAAKIVSTQVVRDFHLNIFQTENPSSPQILTDATAFDFAPGNKIFFSSILTGDNEDIWSVGTDGKEQRQLTTDPADDTTPIAAPDGNSIFFASNRSGEFHIWRTDPDGSNQKQITNNKGGFPLHISPDGKWIYYRSTIDNMLRRTTFDGTVEELFLDKRKQNFAFSPDGLQLAYFEKVGETRVINIILIADKQSVKVISLAEPGSKPISLKWSPDGKYLAYILADKTSAHKTLWFQPLDSKTPKRIGDLGSDEVSQFEFAPDGNTFAVIKGVWKHDAVLLKGLK